MQQRPRARADDDDFEVFVQDGSWSEGEGKPYNKAGKTFGGLGI